MDRDTNNIHYGEYYTPSSTLQGSAREFYNPVAFANLSQQKRVKDNARALFTIRYLITPELFLTQL